MKYLKLIKIALIITLVIFAIGCSSTPKHQQKNTHISEAHLPTPSKPLSKKQTAVYNRLNVQYKNWVGTPYELGGMNKKGIDCSGFVHVAFRDGLGMNIPRTTATLSRKGTQINKQQLKIGDLVFFRIERNKRHVGIYVGNQYFIHASTSKGVMKSNLSNPYWRKYYWKSVRLLEN